MTIGKRFGLFFAVAALTVLMLGGGVFAMTNASAVTIAATSRWAGATAQSVNTQGGNISVVNITTSSLTSRWAAFSGNVSNTISLQDGTNTVFSWSSWTAATGGRVCLSTGANFNFATPQALGNSSAVNQAWSFGAASDNSTNTYNVTCAVTVGGTGVTGTMGVVIGGSSSYRNCVINDGANTTKANFAFCTNISSSGTDYKGRTTHYELMVPASASETYNFFMEPD